MKFAEAYLLNCSLSRPVWLPIGEVGRLRVRQLKAANGVRKV